MARAFLSHSSDDKAYVDIVARKLSRSRVVYDRQDFAPGEDFRDSILRGLDDSSVFILFASARSLASTWVKFEIAEAEARRVAGKLKSVLVVVIDPDVKPSDLPPWMQRGLFSLQTRPSQAARLVLSKLMQAEGADKQLLFVGREELLKEVAAHLPPPGGLPAPQVLVFSGLEGVGRRSAARRALNDNLNLGIGPVLVLEDTDDLGALYLQLLEDANLLTTRDDYKKSVKAFRVAPPNEQAKMIAREIEAIAKDNAAIMIVDQGALIEESGMFTDSVAALFSEIVSSKAEPYVVVVQRRRPPMAQTTSNNRIASFAVPPLSLEATRRLFVQSYKAMMGASPDEKAVQSLVPYLDGYPPAVQLAVAYAKRYGLEPLIADKSSLIDLKVRTFDRVLNKIQLDPTDQLILRVLGMEPGLSFDVLATITSVSVADLVPRVTRLIDHSVIVRYADALSLAAPMRDSVYREFGIVLPNEYSTFAQRLKEKYWADPEKIPDLDAIDATLYTTARASGKEFEEFADLVMPSMLLKVATAAYHERNYKAARDFAQRATDADPLLDRGWVILAKAYIRLAHEGVAEWSQAEAAVARLRQRGHRQQHYLAGLLDWKRGELAAAVHHFKQAENAGDRGVAVYRDRAHCRFRLGLIDDALADIQVALSKYPRNPFIIDLAAAIAVRGGKYPIAEAFLKDMEEVEPRKEHYYHRLSTLYAAKGQFPRALAEADRAALRNPPVHEILTNRIDILIELERYPDALLELDRVGQHFKGRTAKDVQTGLRCKLALRQGNWREAEVFHGTLHNKDFPVHKSLRVELLRQKSIDHTLSADERKVAREEAQALAAEIAAAGVNFVFVADEVDDDD